MSGNAVSDGAGAAECPRHGPPLNAARRHVCQRRRKDVEHWFTDGGTGRSPFPKRDQDEIVIQLSAEAREAIKKGLSQLE